MNKPICRYCKYKKSTSITPICKLSKHMDEVGNRVYTKCSYKNKDFKCLDFKPKWYYRRKYK